MQANLYYEIDKQTGNVRLPITHADGVIYKDGRVSDVLDSIDCSLLYVDKNGDDSNDGSKDYPLATIAEAVSAADRQESKNVTIIVADGEYSFDETLVIDSIKNITIIADGEVIFNSLHEVQMAVSSNGELVSVNGGYSPEWIFANGERRLLASTIRPTHFTIKGGALKMASIPWYQGYTLQHYALDDSGNRTNYSASYASNANLFGKRLFIEMDINAEDEQRLLQGELWKRVRVHTYNQWTSKFCSIEKIENGKLTLRQYNNDHDSPSLWTGSKVLIENIPFVLSTFNNVGQTETYVKGSFYFDGSGKIHYKKKDGESNPKIQVATLSELIRVSTPCKFVGIKFTGTTYDWLDENGVCPDRQGAYMIEPSIRVYGSDVHFYACEFTDMEATCIGYYEGSKDGSVRKCYFHNIGSSSVRLGENHSCWAQEVGVNPDWNTTDNPPIGTYVLPKNISVENNVVANYGELFEQSCGIIMFFTDNCHIRHNDVIFGYYTGITYGYCWDDNGESVSDPTHHPHYWNDGHYQRGGSIAYNRVAYIGGDLLADMGGIYGLGRTNGLQIKGNSVGYVHATNDTAFGIYCDSGVCEAIVTDNEVYKCKLGYVSNNYQRGTQFIHNAANNCEIAFQSARNNQGVVVKDNVFSQNRSNLKVEYSVGNTIENNLWYSTSASLDLSGYDSNPQYGNPYFADGNNGNFHVLDDTNTSKIGWYENTYTAGVLNPQQKEIVRTYADEERRYKILYV